MSHMNDFQIEQVDDAIVITPGPRISSLDNNYLAERRTALVEVIRNSPESTVIVDFSRVGYFGSLLLDTLCVVWKQARERSGTMSLCNLTDVSKEILNKSRLNSLWPVFSSRQEALDASQRARENEPIAASEASTLTHDREGESLSRASAAPRRLRLQPSGDRTVVGFVGGDVPPDYALCRELSRLTNLIDQKECREFVFDMAGVSSVPSGFLGVLTSLLNRGGQISVSNSSSELREILAITNLDRRVRYEPVE
jgi:anti-sigma B factor antagonist